MKMMKMIDVNIHGKDGKYGSLPIDRLDKKRFFALSNKKLLSIRDYYHQHHSSVHIFMLISSFGSSYGNIF